MNVQKRNWDLIKKRWEAWWACDYYDRPVIQISAPKIPASPAVDPKEIEERGKNPRIKFGDIDYVIKATKFIIENTYFGGETLTYCNAGWAVGQAAFCGCEPVFTDDSIWVHPIPGGTEDKYPEYKFDRENYWWKWLNEFQKKAMAENDGQYMLLPHLGNPTFDALVQVRGATEFLCDLGGNKPLVKEHMKKMGGYMREMYKDQLELISRDKSVEGYINPYRAWSPGTMLGLEADSAVFISPEDYKEIIVPDLIEIMGMVDYNMYHIDGPLYLKFIDILLDLPELKAIQWLPGHGAAGLPHWIPLIQKIQAKKKPVLIYGSPDQIIDALKLKEIKPEGLAVNTGAASEDEADRFAEKLEKMYR